jgi:DNA-binding HxlR family transcriptional regulator
VGERWNLLVIRDLITGPKRFTDLMDRLGGITPKTLSQRLSELEDAGIVIADREPGRREVWYRLTQAGADLGPVIGMLNWWGLRHAWRWPQAGEPLHAEHLWSVTASPSPAPADVTITATTQSLAALIFTGSDAGIDITGETGGRTIPPAHRHHGCRRRACLVCGAACRRSPRPPRAPPAASPLPRSIIGMAERMW